MANVTATANPPAYRHPAACSRTPAVAHTAPTMAADQAQVDKITAHHNISANAPSGGSRESRRAAATWARSSRFG